MLTKEKQSQYLNCFMWERARKDVKKKKKIAHTLHRSISYSLLNIFPFLSLPCLQKWKIMSCRMRSEQLREAICCGNEEVKGSKWPGELCE